MLKFKFNALIQKIGIYLLWLRPLHTAKNRPNRPTMFHTATVRPTRSSPRILYNTPLNLCPSTCSSPRWSMPFPQCVYKAKARISMQLASYSRVLHQVSAT